MHRVARVTWLMEDLSCRRHLCISTKVPQEVNDELKPSLLGRVPTANRAGTHPSSFLIVHAYDLQIFFQSSSHGSWRRSHLSAGNSWGSRPRTSPTFSTTTVKHQAEYKPPDFYSLLNMQDSFLEELCAPDVAEEIKAERSTTAAMTNLCVLRPPRPATR